VRERGEIGERETVLVQRRAELAVANAGFDRDGRRVDLDDTVEMRRREQSAARRCVGDLAEGVTCAEGPNGRRGSDELLRLLHRPRVQNARRPVGEVAGPVLHDGTSRIVAGGT